MSCTTPRRVSRTRELTTSEHFRLSPLWKILSHVIPACQSNGTSD
ncbi:MAG: hypothetical protein ACOYNN_02215 [Terrimicrobiaceae bacterium]